MKQWQRDQIKKENDKRDRQATVRADRYARRVLRGWPKISESFKNTTSFIMIIGGLSVAVLSAFFVLVIGIGNVFLTVLISIIIAIIGFKIKKHVNNNIKEEKRMEVWEEEQRVKSVAARVEADRRLKTKEAEEARVNAIKVRILESEQEAEKNVGAKDDRHLKAREVEVDDIKTRIIEAEKRARKNLGLEP